MKVGFTGTQRGMTTAQVSTFWRLMLPSWSEFHVGDCIGADRQATDLVAASLPLCVIIGHPPDNPSKRSNYPYHVILPEKPYLSRNKDIVRAVDFMIATPGEFDEQIRSGTWSTVRYAGVVKVEVRIILPDGSQIIRKPM